MLCSSPQKRQDRLSQVHTLSFSTLAYYIFESPGRVQSRNYPSLELVTYIPAYLRGIGLELAHRYVLSVGTQAGGNIQHVLWPTHKENENPIRIERNQTLHRL